MIFIKVAGITTRIKSVLPLIAAIVISFKPNKSGKDKQSTNKICA